MLYKLINDKFRKGQFSVFPELFYSSCLYSFSNRALKPRESLILATNRLNYILSMAVNELGHGSKQQKAT